MSLYNMMFNTNPLAGVLMEWLNLTTDQCGRFRDCYLSEDSGELSIIVFTRNGGGNRPDYEEVFERLSKHPLYVRNWDDPFDSTYAGIEFKIPDERAEDLEELWKTLKEMNIDRQRIVYPSLKKRFDASLKALRHLE